MKPRPQALNFGRHHPGSTLAQQQFLDILGKFPAGIVKGAPFDRAPALAQISLYLSVSTVLADERWSSGGNNSAAHVVGEEGSKLVQVMVKAPTRRNDNVDVDRQAEQALS